MATLGGGVGAAVGRGGIGLRASAGAARAQTARSVVRAVLFSMRAAFSMSRGGSQGPDDGRLAGVPQRYDRLISYRNQRKAANAGKKAGSPEGPPAESRAGPG